MFYFSFSFYLFLFILFINISFINCKKKLFDGKAGANYGFDLNKADLVVVDSISRTDIPKSTNPYGQIIYIKRGGGSVANIGTNPQTTVINDAKDFPVHISYSRERTKETKIRIDDNKGTLIENPNEGLYSLNPRPADPIEQQRMQRKIMQHTGFNAEEADFIYENGKGKRIELISSINPHGLFIEINKSASIYNVGDAPITFLSNLAQEGKVIFSLSPLYDSNKRLIVYNAGTLISEDPVLSFRQIKSAAPSPPFAAAAAAGAAAVPAAAAATATTTTTAAAPSSSTADNNNNNNNNNNNRLRSIFPHKKEEKEEKEEKLSEKELLNIVAHMLAATRRTPARNKSFI